MNLLNTVLVFHWYWILLSVVRCHNTVYRTVKTRNGFVRGIESKSLVKKVLFFSFKGIPYAKKPIGHLRFKPPVPIGSWGPNVYDAFEYGRSCYWQSFVAPLTVPRSEDCLTLNVFVPSKSQEENAVMVYFHGGMFTESQTSDTHYGADLLVENGVILVTLNYRLGAFGFMSLGNCEYSGNMGLKDQKLALKWVYENIHNFGGDKTRITLFGQGAGAAAVHYHVLSPKSRKKFHRAISMSGSAFNNYALSKRNSLRRMYKFAKDINQPQDTYDDLVKFLKEVSADLIVNNTSQFGEYNRTLITYWPPTLESSKCDDSFLTETPEQYYNHDDADVEILFSVTKNEYQSFRPSDAHDPKRIESLNKNFNITLPFPGFNFSFKSKQYQQLALKVRKFYFGIKPITERSLFNYLLLLSYINIEYGITKAVKAQSKKSSKNTYYVRFSAMTELAFSSVLLNNTFLPFAGNGDDLCFIFRCGALNDAYQDILATKDTDPSSTIAYQLLIDMPQLYTNFAKTGNPTIDESPLKKFKSFKPVRKNKIFYIDITKKGYIPKINIRMNQYRFWRRLEKEAKEIILLEKKQQKQQKLRKKLSARVKERKTIETKGINRFKSSIIPKI